MFMRLKTLLELHIRVGIMDLFSGLFYNIFLLGFGCDLWIWCHVIVINLVASHTCLHDLWSLKVCMSLPTYYQTSSTRRLLREEGDQRLGFSCLCKFTFFFSFSFFCNSLSICTTFLQKWIMNKIWKSIIYIPLPKMQKQSQHHTIRLTIDPSTNFNFSTLWTTLFWWWFNIDKIHTFVTS